MNWFRRLLGIQTDEDTQPKPRLSRDAPGPEPQRDSRGRWNPPPDEEDDETLQTRPLAPPREFKNTRQVLRVGQLTHTGQVRNTNQDACMTFVAVSDVTNSPPPIGVFIVADGMGGHHDGEMASTIAVQTLTSRMLRDVVVPHLDGHEQDLDQKTIPEALEDAMAAANKAVRQRIADGGTTATCAVVRGDLAFIGHVGDSRAYLISDEVIEPITRDHSLVRRLQELGQLTAEEAEVHPQRNVLYRALGQDESLEIDTVTRRLPPASRLMLCSDGMWGVVGDARMRELLDEHDDPQEACDRLVAEANMNGGPDNITVVLIQMPD
ncbi:MAG TPA: PP2C family serine/threonine-protein phosphatase [Aggregatilineales bacterium]|jgi:serine/threonine protein phosphatase PrpC|nr:PP2C family serine/threonine-protein phosphatase [Aggregatilineales bacterium]